MTIQVGGTSDELPETRRELSVTSTCWVRQRGSQSIAASHRQQILNHNCRIKTRNSMSGAALQVFFAGEARACLSLSIALTTISPARDAANRRHILKARLPPSLSF
jgi:hypothetical protein